MRRLIPSRIFSKYPALAFSVSNCVPGSISGFKAGPNPGRPPRKPQPSRRCPPARPVLKNLFLLPRPLPIKPGFAAVPRRPKPVQEPLLPPVMEPSPLGPVLSKPGMSNSSFRRSFLPRCEYNLCAMARIGGRRRGKWAGFPKSGNNLHPYRQRTGDDRRPCLRR